MKERERERERKRERERGIKNDSNKLAKNEGAGRQGDRRGDAI